MGEPLDLSQGGEIIVWEALGYNPQPIVIEITSNLGTFSKSNISII